MWWGNWNARNKFVAVLLCNKVARVELPQRWATTPARSDVWWAWEHPYPSPTKISVLSYGELGKKRQTWLKKWELVSACNENSAAWISPLCTSFRWNQEINFLFPTLFFLSPYTETFTSVGSFDTSSNIYFCTSCFWLARGLPAIQAHYHHLKCRYLNFFLESVHVF